MKDTRCSVLINSCDKYEDAWLPYMKLAEKFWPDCPYQFYLNTEHKPFSNAGFPVTVLNVLVKDDEKNVPWGKRLKDCLLRIQSPYVIIMLEDFFLQAPVNQEELARCINLMENDERYAAIYFKQIAGFTEVDDAEPKYFQMKENKMYKLNLQAGIWRKSDLEALVEDDDSPWSFEFVGQDRLEGRDKIFLCSMDGTHYKMDGAVFPYLTGRTTGYGIWTGKWLWNNDQLFRKNGIKTGEISLERFTRLDMLKYYFKRIGEEISKVFNKNNNKQ